MQAPVGVWVGCSQCWFFTTRGRFQDPWTWRPPRRLEAGACGVDDHIMGAEHWSIAKRAGKLPTSKFQLLSASASLLWFQPGIRSREDRVSQFFLQSASLPCKGGPRTRRGNALVEAFGPGENSSQGVIWSGKILPQALVEGFGRGNHSHHITPPAISPASVPHQSLLISSHGAVDTQRRPSVDRFVFSSISSS